jgi:hypothetical protein
VSLVGSGMNGDSVCTKILNIDCSFYHIRYTSASGIPKRGNLIDVYAQSGHVSRFSFLDSRFWFSCGELVDPWFRNAKMGKNTFKPLHLLNNHYSVKLPVK